MSELASDWAKNNHRTGITSFLVRIDTHFLQLLEGPPRGVSELMDRIWDDGRHGEVDILLTGHDSRHFSNAHPLGFVDLVRGETAGQLELPELAAACGEICRDSAMLHAWLTTHARDHALLQPR